MIYVEPKEEYLQEVDAIIFNVSLGLRMLYIPFRPPEEDGDTVLGLFYIRGALQELVSHIIDSPDTVTVVNPIQTRWDFEVRLEFNVHDKKGELQTLHRVTQCQSLSNWLAGGNDIDKMAVAICMDTVGACLSAQRWLTKLFIERDGQRDFVDAMFFRRDGAVYV